MTAFMSLEGRILPFEFYQKNKKSKMNAKINQSKKTTMMCPRINVAELMESRVPEWYEFSLQQRCGTYIRDYFEERNRILQHEALAKYGGLERLLNSILRPQNEARSWCDHAQRTKRKRTITTK